jgi:hypothetical protein
MAALINIEVLLVTRVETYWFELELGIVREFRVPKRASFH